MKNLLVALALLLLAGALLWFAPREPVAPELAPPAVAPAAASAGTPALALEEITSQSAPPAERTTVEEPRPAAGAPTSEPGARAPEPPAHEAAPPLRVLVLSREKGKLAGAPVPNIHFELHSLDGCQAESRLYAGVTDGEGECLVELPPDAGAPDERGQPGLRSLVTQVGLQRQLGRPSREPVDASRADVLFLLSLRPGATALLRVVTESGAGVQARISPLQWIQEPGGPVLKTIFGPFSVDVGDGLRQLHLSDDWTGLLSASAGDLGTGVLGPLTISLASPPQDLEIVVRGPGRLKGRLTDAAGQPAAATKLLALLSELDDEAGSFVLPEPLASQRRAQGGGREWALTETDATGRFDFRGLRAAPYVVRAQYRTDQRGYPVLLTDAPVLADGTDLALTFTRTHLALRLLDADGQPWSGARPEPLGPYAAFPETWPKAPQVVVLPADAEESGRVARARGPKASGSPGGGTLIYELPEGGRFLVGAFGGGFDGSLTTLDVPENAGRVELELRARPEVELARLDVLVTAVSLPRTSNASGRADEPYFDVSLESLDSGAVLLAYRGYQPPFHFDFQAPPGSYRVVAEGQPGIDDYHGVLYSQRLLGRAESPVQLVSASKASLTLDLAPGGRLELDVTGEPSPRDLKAVRERHPDLVQDNTELLEQWAHAATFELRWPDHRPEIVYRTIELRGTSAAGTHQTGEWPLGTHDTSQMLPAGDFTLIARLPGGRELRRAVTIRPNETTPVSLEF